MIGALFDIHCKLHGWGPEEDKAEQVVCIDEVPFL